MYTLKKDNINFHIMFIRFLIYFIFILINLYSIINIFRYQMFQITFKKMI